MHALATISQAHQAAQQESPTKNSAVRTVWAGIRRAKGIAPERKAPDLRRMLETLEDDSLLGIRDRALIVIGFAGAFRRSKLVVLDSAVQKQRGWIRPKLLGTLSERGWLPRLRWEVHPPTRL